LEGQYAAKYGSIQTISEQELVDCDNNDSGCDGGLMANAFKWLIQEGGEVTEASYPYTSGGTGEAGTCELKKPIYPIKSYDMIDCTVESNMQEALYTIGPLAIAMNADPLQAYTGGILDIPTSECDPTALDHGVTLVAYGTASNGQAFWVIKNSWGADWGENGFFRIANTGEGLCGINTYVCTCSLS